MTSEPSDRRPIAARKLGVFAAMAGWLVHRDASPHVISVAGMLAGMLAGLVLAGAPGHRSLWLLSAVLVQLRLLANMLDGMVAVGRGVASRLGEVFNEVPDRVADTAVLAGLGMAAGSLSLGLGAGLAAMATAYVRAVGRGMGQGSVFCGPGAKQHRMAVVTAVAVWCCVAPSRWAAPVPSVGLWIIVALASATVVRRTWRLCRGLQR